MDSADGIGNRAISINNWFHGAKITYRVSNQAVYWADTKSTNFTERKRNCQLSTHKIRKRCRLFPANVVTFGIHDCANWHDEQKIFQQLTTVYEGMWGYPNHPDRRNPSSPHDAFRLQALCRFIARIFFSMHKRRQPVTEVPALASVLVVGGWMTTFPRC